MDINYSPLVAFFRKKFSRAESYAEDFLVCVVRRNFDYHLLVLPYYPIMQGVDILHEC